MSWPQELIRIIFIIFNEIEVAANFEVKIDLLHFIDAMPIGESVDCISREERSRDCGRRTKFREEITDGHLVQSVLVQVLAALALLAQASQPVLAHFFVSIDVPKGARLPEHTIALHVELAWLCGDCETTFVSTRRGIE